MGAIAAVIALVIGGIVVFGGSDDDNGATGSTIATDDTNGSDTTLAGGGQAITSVDDAGGAVVRIETDGTIRDPEIGQTSNAGAGSGFIIDPSRHRGHQQPRRHGRGDHRGVRRRLDEPKLARVLGVSECSDLAVIDIEGDGYPFLNWFDGEIKPGIDVFAAGYPLDDPEFTLTKGIVSKAKADDISPSSNIDHVIEHDANIQPGNSGGPLITEDAQVVGVNYAGFDFAGTGTEQFFAIASDTRAADRRAAAAGRRTSTRSASTAAAVADDESGIVRHLGQRRRRRARPRRTSGSSPATSSPQMAGKDVGTDGTMKDYCDVLRTKGQDAGDRRRGAALRHPGGAPRRVQRQGARAGVLVRRRARHWRRRRHRDLRQLLDRHRRLERDPGRGARRVERRARRPQDIAASHAPSIQASPDVDDFLNTFDVPGMEFVLSDQFTPDDFETILDAVGPSEFCTSDGREDYSDPIFTGRFEVWTDCQGTDAQYIVVVASEADSTEVAIVTVQAIDDRDFDALDHILDTFSTTTTDLGGDYRRPWSRSVPAARRLADAGRSELCSHCRADARSQRRRGPRACAEPTE